MTTDPSDPGVLRVLGRSQAWLVAAAGALWTLAFGVAAVIVLQLFRREVTVDDALPTTPLQNVATLVALADLAVLGVGIALMAWTLTRQSEAVGGAIRGERTVAHVLRLMRRFWRIFAVTLVGVTTIGCGALFAGTAGALDAMLEQLETDDAEEAVP